MAFVVKMMVFSVMRPYSPELANVGYTTFAAVPIFFLFLFSDQRVFTVKNMCI